jgi:hypothetical protein
MNVTGRILAVLTGGFVLTSIAAAIAARVMKERIIPIDAPDANEVRLAAIFEPIDFRSRANAFRGGTLECWYGGGVIDLRDAFLDPGGARLEVRAVFGGAQIVVPETWRVTTSVVGIGGIGDARSKVERPVTAPLLVIEGIAIMGGFGITSELSEREATAVADAVARRAGRPESTLAETEPAPVS